MGCSVALMACSVFFEEPCLRHRESEHLTPRFGLPGSPLCDVQSYRGHPEAAQAFPGQTGKQNVGIQPGIERGRQEAQKAVRKITESGDSQQDSEYTGQEARTEKQKPGCQFIDPVKYPREEKTCLLQLG